MKDHLKEGDEVVSPCGLWNGFKRGTVGVVREIKCGVHSSITNEFPGAIEPKTQQKARWRTVVVEYDDNEQMFLPGFSQYIIQHHDWVSLPNRR
jgi:hypothetical protein